MNHHGVVLDPGSGTVHVDAVCVPRDGVAPNRRAARTPKQEPAALVVVDMVVLDERRIGVDVDTVGGPISDLAG